MRRLTSVLFVGAIFALGMALSGCGSDSGGSGSGDDSAGTTSAPTGVGTVAGTTEGGTTADGTTEGGTTEGATTEGGTTGSCEPFCQPGWECGPDGCGGVCGTGCSGGLVCNNAKHVCEDAPPPPPQANAYGEQCGRQGDCQPNIYTEDGWQDNPQWPACVNAQCESGTCFEPACTKTCTLTKDQTDHAGNPGPDGIDDPDKSFNDCAGAADGPMGTEFTCVALLPPDQGQPLNMCQPGTTFEPCGTNADCKDGETCQLQYILGTYSTRCSAPPKAAASIAEYCNRNPEDGDVKYCETTLCFGIGCTGFCNDDSDCGSTAFECREDFDLFGDPESPKFSVCMGKSCGSNTDCPEDGYHCTISGNGKEGNEIDWDHVCKASAPNAAALGEQCETDTSDNIPLPDCAGPCLNNGTCSAICNEDADCAAVPSMKCNFNESGVDFDNDGVDDKLLPLGLCVDYPGSNVDCADDATCGGTEACSFLEYKNASGDLDGKGLCTTPDSKDNLITQECGGNTGAGCASGFCLGSNGDQPGYCTSMCDSAADCPQGDNGAGVSLGLFSGSYHLVCRALLYSQGGTVNTPDDNIYVSLCVPVNTETSSAADCSTDWNSCPAGQACTGFGIGHGATGPTSLEMACIGNGGFTSQNQPIPATGNLGDSCDITFSNDNGVYCNSNYCLPDAGADQGYCSELCTSNADCAGGSPDMICDDYVLLDRKDDADDVTIGLCRKQKSCVSCVADTDCAGNYVCVNAGGVGLLADYRCAPPCSAAGDDASCAGTDGGNTCSESVNADGTGEGVFACVPGNC